MSCGRLRAEGLTCVPPGAHPHQPGVYGTYEEKVFGTGRQAPGEAQGEGEEPAPPPPRTIKARPAWDLLPFAVQQLNQVGARCPRGTLHTPRAQGKGGRNLGGRGEAPLITPPHLSLQSALGPAQP